MWGCTGCTAHAFRVINSCWFPLLQVEGTFNVSERLGVLCGFSKILSDFLLFDDNGMNKFCVIILELLVLA